MSKKVGSLLSALAFSAILASSLQAKESGVFVAPSIGYSSAKHSSSTNLFIPYNAVVSDSGLSIGALAGYNYMFNSNQGVRGYVDYTLPFGVLSSYYTYGIGADYLHFFANDLGLFAGASYDFASSVGVSGSGFSLSAGFIYEKIADSQWDFELGLKYYLFNAKTSGLFSSYELKPQYNLAARFIYNF